MEKSLYFIIIRGYERFTDMMERGNIKIDVTKEELDLLYFPEEVICYKQIPILEKYYHDSNSRIYEIFHEDVPSWMYDILKQLPIDYTHSYFSILKVPPGQTIPYHIDKHYKIQEKYGKGETFRYWIALEEWKHGHYFEVGNVPIVNWKRGDWVRFEKEWHLGGNMGIDVKYIAQVTCIK